MLFIDNATVQQILTIGDAIDSQDTAFRGLVDGAAIHRPRIDMYVPTGREDDYYRWGTMEGASRDLGVFAIRMKSDVVSWPEDENGNWTEEKHCVEPGTYCGLIFLFSTVNGEPLAIINDGELQHMRVGAGGGLGARYLSREDSRVVGMLGSGGMAPLHWAAVSSENASVIKVLLNAGADVKARTVDGGTPLHRAATWKKNPAVVQVLLAAGADVNAREKMFGTPLHSAAMSNENPAVVEVLLAGGADLEARTERGETPLHEAAEWNENPAVVKVLLATGAVLEARDKGGSTPLHRGASNNENPAVVKALLEAGAELEARNVGGGTPLHMAVRFKENSAVVTTLLDAGANPKAKTTDGKTVFDLIQENDKLKGSDAYWRLNDLRFE